MNSTPELPNSRAVETSRVGLRELGQNVSRVLTRVKRGESLVVTEHGRPIAYVTPYANADALEELVARGEATPADSPIQEAMAHFPPVASPLSGSSVLAQMREDER